jgi:transcriptional regulator with XRE-family HTH domain
MKRTEEDQQFGAEFAKRLKPIYEKALAEGQTEKAFAKRLGVDRGGLHRYLQKHAMPSHRTVVLAYREFGITIPYAGVGTQALISRRTRKSLPSSALQMDLPLTIEAPQGEISVVVKRKTAQRYRLQLHVRKLG